MSKLIVVAFEFIHINHDAAPGSGQGIAGLLKHGKKAAIEASGERVADALFAQLVLQLLALGDVHQNADGPGDALVKAAQRVDPDLEGAALPLHLVAE